MVRTALLVVALGLLGAAPHEKRRIDLDVRDADVHDVLRLLADTGQVNLVVADHVKGRVTLKLKNVPWSEALAVVLRAKGLGQERTGNVIHVDTLENMTRRSEQKAALEKSREATAELLTVMIPLSYARAEDMKPIVESLLTERGTVAVEKRNNLLVVTDVAHNVERVRAELGL